MCLDAPLEGCEGDDQKRVQAVLQRIWLGEASPEGTRSKRPALRIRTQNDEDGEAYKHQRPVRRPPPATRKQSEGAGGEHNESRPVVVVLRPGTVDSIAGTAGRVLRVYDSLRH